VRLSAGFRRRLPWAMDWEPAILASWGKAQRLSAAAAQTNTLPDQQIRKATLCPAHHPAMK
jgi:hypothetical protein